MAIPPAPPEIAAPPAPQEPPAERPAIRPAYVGVASTVVWIIGAFVAFKILGIYPLSAAKVTLYTGWLIVGGLAWVLAARGKSVNAWGAVVAAGLVPLLLVTAVPGIRRPTQHPIPGGGSYALYASPRGLDHIYLIHNGDGAHPIQLTNNPWPDLYPQLSPDGTKVVFSSGEGGSALSLHLISLDAAGHVTDDRALVQASVDATDAHWSNDGASVYFVESINGLDTLMRTDLEGHVSTVVRSVSNPAPSPDGTQIALSWSSGIWLVSTAGTDPQEIIHTGSLDYGPTWSPDGSRIAFTERSGTNEDVYVANAAGTDVRDLTADTAGSTDYAFGWTPDGHILFLSTRSNTGGNFIYSMNADGSGVQLVAMI